MPAPRPRRVLGWLVVATGVPVVVLSGLAAWVLAQERDADRERQRAALTLAADRLALELDRRFDDVAATLSPETDIALRPAGVEGPATARLLYQPQVDSIPELPSATLMEAEALENQKGDLTRASAAYRRIAQTATGTDRARAFVGLGRVLRRMGQHTSALETYSSLASLGSTPIDGQPAALVAHVARGRTLEALGDRNRLAEEAVAFARALSAGGWSIDQATFESNITTIRAWQPSAPLPSTGSLARTDAAVRVWHSWRAGNLSAQGRTIIDVAGTPVLGIWATRADTPLLWLSTKDDLESLIRPLAVAQNVAVAGTTSDGRRLFGELPPGAVSVIPSNSRLPFILGVASSAPAAAGGRTRQLLIAGLATAFVLMLTAAYAIYRVTTRELGVARQQADFVSAVSHEFRTPLTSMRHLTDLLRTRSTIDDDRRAHYYDLLSTETERLHRMVEGLLSFGRIEAGAYVWRLESFDLASLVRSVVDEFRRDAAFRQRSVTCHVPDAVLPAVVDSDAISRALSNLIENAAKYSPPGSPIDVTATRSGVMAHIAVTDRGVGIPSAEHGRIFEKFARGAHATAERVAGVGIGLSLVKQIVEGHGGSVSIESEPGRGSTFTLAVPLERADGSETERAPGMAGGKLGQEL